MTQKLGPREQQLRELREHKAVRQPKVKAPATKLRRAKKGGK